MITRCESDMPGQQTCSDLVSPNILSQTFQAAQTNTSDYKNQKPPFLPFELFSLYNFLPISRRRLFLFEVPDLGVGQLAIKGLCR